MERFHQESQAQDVDCIAAMLAATPAKNCQRMLDQQTHFD
jgi:hypothetical protein